MKRFVFLTTMLLALVARPAFATSIVVTGNTSFTVNWLYTSTTPDLSATARFTISNFTSSGFKLTVDQIANTTPISPDIDARMVTFGFDLGPNATGHSSVVNGANFSWGFSNFPGFGAVDVCGYAGNNCAGGSNAGLDQGQTMPGGMSLVFTGPFSNGATFSTFAIKFQTNPMSYEVEGCVVGVDCANNRGGEATSPVPEPASMVLLGTGLVFIASRLRRSRRQAQ